MNFDDPKDLGLLQFGLGMLQAGGPRPYRQTFGAGLAEGAQQGLRAYSAQKLLLEKQKEMEQERQIRQMQITQLLDRMEQQKLLRQAGIDAYQTPLGEANSMVSDATGSLAPTLENAALQSQAAKTATGGINPQMFLQNALRMKADPLLAAQTAQALKKTEDPLQIIPAGAVGARGNKVVITNPVPEKKDKGPPSLQEFLIAQENPAFAQFLRERRPQGTTIKLPASENEYDKGLGKGMAERHLKAYEGAEFGTKAINMLDRLDEFVKQAPPTGGPIAPIEVWARNFAAEYGFPLDKVTDESNARLTAEFSSFLADQIIGGGRGITDEDVRVISRSFPSFSSGIPRSQLPAFMAQLRRIAQQKIDNWNSVYSGMSPQQRAKFSPIGVRSFGGRKDPRTMTDEELGIGRRP